MLSATPTLTAVMAEFGTSPPRRLREFLRGGSFVPSDFTSIPASGSLKLKDFAGKGYWNWPWTTNPSTDNSGSVGTSSINSARWGNNGQYLFSITDDDPCVIRRQTASTAYTPSTLGSAATASLTEVTTGYGFVIDTAGTVLRVFNSADSTIKRYAFGTAWDVSTLSYVGSGNVSANVSEGYDMCFGAGSENHLMFLDTGGVIVLATSVAGDFYGDFSSFDASAVIGTSFNPSDRIFDISAPYNQLIGSSSNLTIVPRGNTLEFFTRTSSTSVSSFGGLTHRHSKSVATG